MGKRDHDDSDDTGKAWCALLLIAVVIVIVIIVVLALTVFRVRDPQITVSSIQLRSFSLTFPPDGPHLSFILDLVVSVKNRNHASFKYDPSTAFLYYRGTSIGQAPVPEGQVKAESTTSIAAEVNIDASAFLGDPNLPGDIQTGTVPLVTTTTLQGEVDVATIVKHHATSVANCNLNVYVPSGTVGDFSCTYKFHL